MKVIHGRSQGKPSEQRGPTFTGVVWADPILAPTGGVGINHVFFSPGARTHWHTHAQGQTLQVTSGAGWICVEGEQPEPIRSGDFVYIPGDVKHWHGAAADSFMAHIATSLGDADWMEAVSDADYAKAV